MKSYVAFYPNRMLPAYYSVVSDSFSPCEDGNFSVFGDLERLSKMCKVHNKGKSITNWDFLSPRLVEYKFLLPS